MVKGLDFFRERFRGFKGSFVLIGGAACDDWFTSQGLAFRATRDLDIVLLIEALDRKFVAAFRGFVEEGGYEIRQRSNNRPILYRFARPRDARFPAMLELFSRRPDVFEPADGQTVVPVATTLDDHSLSAILLDEAYSALLENEHADRNGLHIATVTALIPMKARAWLDLTDRRDRGEKVDSKDIDKHRTDVFRLAATLPEQEGPELPDTVRRDLERFLASFPEDSPEWPRILAALKATFGGNLRSPELVAAIRMFFGIRNQEL